MFALLETFIAVFETKSFTRAANQCFISQPTATVRIKKLEEELKVHLFWFCCKVSILSTKVPF